MSARRAKVAPRGPAKIADQTIAILKGMTGEAVPEEMQDVIIDAVWDAFTAGRLSVARRAPGGEGR